MSNFKTDDDIDFKKFVQKCLMDKENVDVNNCIVLKDNLSETALDLEYERLKKELYSKGSILEHSKSKQPNYIVFKESSFNKSLKFNKNDINFQIHAYVPENLQDIIDDNETYKNIPIYIGIHGAGSSSFTFNTLCSHLQNIDPNIIFLTYDLRGHGLTDSTNLKDITFNLDDFVGDTNEIITYFLKEIFKENDLPKKSSILLLGHSLGGSICATILSHKTTPTNEDYFWRKNILGLILLDIVEEIAIDSLDKMDIVIQRTPTTFPNIKQCLNWHLGNKLPGNYDSAKFSIPYLFKLCNLKDDKYYLKRITKFKDFKPFWNTWFVGLSDNFVNAKGACKLLILSGADERTKNLDKQLIIGQMQGKYQLTIFNNGGHFIHEDCDFNVALTIAEFVKRNDNKLFDIKTNWKSLQ